MKIFDPAEQNKITEGVMKAMLACAAFLISQAPAFAGTEAGRLLKDGGAKSAVSAEAAAVKPAADTEKPVSAFLDETAARAIKAIAGADDPPFGAIDGGNRGLSAYRLTTRAANLTAWLVEASFPGINLGGKDYSDLGPQLILIVTSDDEPAAHMYDQDRGSGELSRIADFSLADSCERLGSNGSLLKRIAPGADPDTLDWPTVLNGLLGPGNSSPVPLGEGSAEPYWWNQGTARRIF